MTPARRSSVPTHRDGRDPLAVPLDVVDNLNVMELVQLLDSVALERERLGLLDHAVRTRLRELCVTLTEPAPLLRPGEAAQRLNVSVDWLRDHGEALGLVVRMDGLLRYDGAAIEALRQQRARRQLPRD
jgi:hypothetical protein